jgi:hypothetical protein
MGDAFYGNGGPVVKGLLIIGEVSISGAGGEGWAGSSDPPGPSSFTVCCPPSMLLQWREEMGFRLINYFNQMIDEGILSSLPID